MAKQDARGAKEALHTLKLITFDPSRPSLSTLLALNASSLPPPLLVSRSRAAGYLDIECRPGMQRRGCMRGGRRAATGVSLIIVHLGASKRLLALSVSCNVEPLLALASAARKEVPPASLDNLRAFAAHCYSHLDVVVATRRSKHASLASRCPPQAQGASLLCRLAAGPSRRVALASMRWRGPCQRLPAPKRHRAASIAAKLSLEPPTLVALARR